MNLFGPSVNTRPKWASPVLLRTSICFFAKMGEEMGEILISTGGNKAKCIFFGKNFGKCLQIQK